MDIAQCCCVLQLVFTLNLNDLKQSDGLLSRLGPSRAVFKCAEEPVHWESAVTVVAVVVGMVKLVIVRAAPRRIKAVVADLRPQDEIELGVQVNPRVAPTAEEKRNEGC